MNKLFSKVATLSVGLAMAIGVGVAVGSNGVKEARADNGSVTINSASSNTDGVVTVEISKSSGSSAPITGDYGVRLYANNTVTISASSNITSLTIPWTKNSKKDFASVTADVGSYTHPSAAGDGTWTGSAKEIVLTVGTGQIQFNSVAYVTEGSTPTTTYTITYNSNGGSGTMSPTSGANPAVSECTFTAPEGMAFKEWNDSADGKGTAYAVGAKPGANLDLFAIWEKAPSEVNFVAGTDKGSSGGQNEDTITKGTVSLYCSSWRNSDAPYRIYSTDLVISSSGENIIGVEFEMNGSYSSTLFSADVGSYDSSVSTKGVWSGDASSVTFTASAQARCDSIKVTLKEGTDPTKDTLVVKLNDSLVSPQTVNYTPVSGWLFYANDKDGNDINSDWTSSDESIFTVSKNGNNVAVVKPHDIGTATLTASAEGYNSGSFVLTIVPGTVEEIVVTGTMSKTSYYVGESWSHDGLVATATYDTMYEKDVSEEAAWTYSPASPALNVTSVVATATLGTVSGNSSAQTVSVSRTNPIQVLYSQSSGASVDVYGYYVGFLDGTGPVIMDGEYGIVIYDKTADVSGYTEGETILRATGSISIYKGLYEIGSPTISEASSIPEDKVPATPVVYSAKGGETAEYASRLTTVTGIPSYNGTIGEAGASDLTLTFTIGEKTIQVFYKKAAQTADADAFAAIKAAVADSTEITIKGFTGWYKGFQVQMNGYIAPAESYTAEDFAQDLLDQTDAVCAGWEEGDNNHDALEAIWSDLASNDKYPSLPAAQKTILADANRDESGTVVEQAMARYDFLTGKYDLSNFINGRTPIVPAGRIDFSNDISQNSSMIIIVSIAATSALAFTMLLVFKKKKQK